MGNICIYLTSHSIRNITIYIELVVRTRVTYVSSAKGVNRLQNDNDSIIKTKENTHKTNDINMFKHSNS